jgi:hypothetical protein
MLPYFTFLGSISVYFEFHSIFHNLFNNDFQYRYFIDLDGKIGDELERV